MISKKVLAVKLRDFDSCDLIVFHNPIRIPNRNLDSVLLNRNIFEDSNYDCLSGTLHRGTLPTHRSHVAFRCGTYKGQISPVLEVHRKEDGYSI